MAAPIEDMSGDGKLDIGSSNFDPLIALYSSETNVPFPDVRIFNNVAEYESSLTQKGIKRPQKISVGKNQTPSVRRQPRKPPDEPVLQMPDASMPAVKQRMLRNVLTRMDQSFVSGPLSILRRCVQEKLKACIWTRSARSVRGILKGYIVAFDKHFNLALIDVDEVYKTPSVCRKKGKKKLEPEPTSEGASSDTDTISGDIQSRLNIDGRERRQSVKDRLSLPQRPQTSHRPHSAKGDIELPKSRHSHHKTLSTWESSLPCEVTWLGLRREDVRCRHVNQLFVRGDNVVCVNIVNKDT